jgi:hypothetical protein
VKAGGLDYWCMAERLVPRTDQAPKQLHYNYDSNPQKVVHNIVYHSNLVVPLKILAVKSDVSMLHVLYRWHNGRIALHHGVC